MTRPNIVIIMTDQQRWDTLGAYGNDYIRTPNIDRLTEDGVLFEQAFVPIPLCIPSRASLFTGRYPSRQGLGPHSGFPLPSETPNLARSLRDAGYRTMLVGKDHLFGSDGLTRCFDHVVRYDHSGRVPDERVDKEENAIRAARHGRYGERFFEPDGQRAEHAPTRRLTSEAIDAVHDVSAGGQPFFLWLSYPDPHPPYVVTEPYNSMYRGQSLGVPAAGTGELDQKPLRQRVSRRLMSVDEYSRSDVKRIREIYYGMVSFVDDEVGRFVQALHAEGIADNTVVLFMSDHGDYLGDHGMVRKSPAMYDCLIRIPLAISWPGQIKSRRVANTLVESIDLAPTLLDLVGLPTLPGNEGSSLKSLLLGETEVHKDRVFGLYGSAGEPYTEMDVEKIDFDALVMQPHPWMGALTMRGRMAMVRTLDWKLVCYQGGEGELYDLQHDPNELVNRYQDPNCVFERAELASSLIDFMLQTPVETPPQEELDLPLRHGANC